MTETFLLATLAGALASALLVIAYMAKSQVGAINRVIAQADESRKVSNKQLERLTANLLAVTKPQEYAQKRQLSGEPESLTFEEGEVPEHFDSAVDKRAARGLEMKNRLLREQNVKTAQALEQLVSGGNGGSMLDGGMMGQD